MPSFSPPPPKRGAFEPRPRGEKHVNFSEGSTKSASSSTEPLLVIFKMTLQSGQWSLSGPIRLSLRALAKVHPAFSTELAYGGTIRKQPPYGASSFQSLCLMTLGCVL